MEGHGDPVRHPRRLCLPQDRAGRDGCPQRNALYDEALRPAGSRAAQVIVLVAIAARETRSITALARCMGMDHSTLTRNLRPSKDDEPVTVGNEGMATKSDDRENGQRASQAA
jgi:hypothetical protein